MRLDQALVVRHLCESRTEAQELIQKGAVLVNGVVLTKQAKGVGEGDTVEVTGRRSYVSRGGEKLAGIFSVLFGDGENPGEFPISNFQFPNHTLFKGKMALDVGSSTGGFTDYLLQHGVANVDAVDVGTGQLHPSLRANKKISLYENTDIRSFAPGVSYDIIVADLSFIPLEQVLDSILKHAHPGTLCLFLIKPQFEVGKGNTKKGIVRNKELVSSVLDSYETLAYAKDMKDVSLFPCVITGGDGNQEYFLYGVM